MPMTSRERVLTALAHEEPDRVPIVVGPSHSTGMQMPVYRGSQGDASASTPPTSTSTTGRSSGRPPSTRRRTGDSTPTSAASCPGSRPPSASATRLGRPARPYVDDWGHMQTEVEPGVWHPGPHPFRDAATIEEIEHYPWPDPADRSRVAHVRAEAQRLRARTATTRSPSSACRGSSSRSSGRSRCRGSTGSSSTSRWSPTSRRRFSGRPRQSARPSSSRSCDEVGDLLDIVKVGDDLGTQDSLLMSPATYRRVLKPIHADYIAFIKARTPRRSSSTRAATSTAPRRPRRDRGRRPRAGPGVGRQARRLRRA